MDGGPFEGKSSLSEINSDGSSTQGPLYHYVIVRSDLPIGAIVAQTIHAAGESSGKVPSGTRAVALSVPNERALLRLEDRLIELGIAHAAIREPDPPYHGALMAIGLEPTRDPAIRRALRKISLLK